MKTPRISGRCIASGVLFSMVMSAMVVFSSRAAGENAVYEADVATTAKPMFAGSGEIVAGKPQDDNYSAHFLGTRDYSKSTDVTDINMLGEWDHVGNGYATKLIVNQQDGNTFSGTMHGGPLINGLIQGNTVTFTRDITQRQDYTGTIVVADDGSITMSGTFTQLGLGERLFNWSSIKVTTPQEYTLRYSAGSNGRVVGEAEQVVAQGANGTSVRAVPNKGYSFTGWSDGSMANPRTDTNVTANVEVRALFGRAQPGVAGFTAGPQMPAPRMGHQFTTLPDGRAALFGGHGKGFTALSSALFWTPGASEFTSQSMNQVRSWPVFVKMADGRYLLAGGSSNLGVPAYAHTEIYDPAAGTFTPSGTMVRFRSGSGGAALANGRVLLAGAWWTHNDAHTYGELFDPQSGTFTATSPFSLPRALAIVMPMKDGGAVLLGGTNATGTFADMPVERFNPATGKITTLQPMLFPDEPGWRVTMTSNRPTFAHEMADGRYLWLASRTEAEVTSYRLFTFDPSNASIKPLPLKGTLPDSDTAYSLEVLVDGKRSLAHIPALITLSSGESGLEIITVNTRTGAMVRSKNHHVLGYSVYGAGMQVLADGRLFITGGSSDGSNFNPVQDTLLVTPPTLENQANIVVQQGKGPKKNLKHNKSARDFGVVKAGKASKPMVFVIKNDGTARLKQLRVTFKGRQARDFKLVKKPAKSVSPGKATTFKILYKPTKAKRSKATLQIASNDKNESPFRVKLTGKVKK